MSGGRTIPVIADEYVDMEFGTGALKITPGRGLGRQVGFRVLFCWCFPVIDKRGNSQLKIA